MPTLIILIQRSIGRPSHHSYKRKRNKSNPHWNGSSKPVTICRWHDTLCRQAQGLQQKLLELIYEFSEVAGYTINVQKYVAFVYSNNALPEIEIKKTIPFTIVSKRIK